MLRRLPLVGINNETFYREKSARICSSVAFNLGRESMRETADAIKLNQAKAHLYSLE